MYSLHAILRAHSPSNDPDDDYTEVWNCAFEPGILGKNSTVVATCGGNSICLVDCLPGKVIKKYKHLEEETFLTLDWTVLSLHEMAMNTAKTYDRPVAILAVAGLQGDIKLLNPSQLVCYAYLRGHRREVNALAFSKKYPHWLLSASSDKTIMLWYVDRPEGEEQLANNMCLCKFEGAPSSLISLAWTWDEKGFVAGCDDSGVLYYELPKKELDKIQKHRKRSLTGGVTVRGWHQRFFGDEEEYHGSNVDCIHVISGNIVISKGACDGEFIAWDLKDSIEKNNCNPKAVCFLTWHTTDISFIRSKCKDPWLLCGGPEGDIQAFDLMKIREYAGTDQVKNGVKKNGRCAPVIDAPKWILKHPQMEHVIIRCVDISSDELYIVAVTENNGVYIWRKDLES